MLETSNNLIGWIVGGAGITVLSTIAIFFPTLGPRLVAKASKMIPGLSLGLSYSNWDDVLKKTQYAQDRVWILQTWIPHLKKEIEYWGKALERPNMEFRVLLADKSLTPFRVRIRPPHTQSDLAQNIIYLVGLAKMYNKTSGNDHPLEARSYSCIPFGPIYIVDNDIYWGLYLANKCSMMGPAFHCKINSAIGTQIVNSYRDIWNSESTKKIDLNPKLA